MAVGLTDMDDDEAIEWLNGAASELPDSEILPGECTTEELDALRGRLRESIGPRRRELIAQTALSNDEAEVAAFEELGLTHAGIALLFAPRERMSKGAVDEHSDRIIKKYNEAYHTYHHLNDLYGDEEMRG